MRHAAEKICFGKIGDFRLFFGFFKLGRAFPHALFQFFLRTLQSVFNALSLRDFPPQSLMFLLRVHSEPVADGFMQRSNDNQQQIRD